jgi:nitrogen fixation protein NifU and related proteins
VKSASVACPEAGDHSRKLLGRTKKITVDKTHLDFWQRHSLQFLEMALSADKRERLVPADAHGQAQGACGDRVDIFLKVQDGHIRTASFETNGCLYTVACANTVVRLAEGKTLTEAGIIEPEGVFRWLETLPREEFHCAELAIGALRKALASVVPAALE